MLRRAELVAGRQFSQLAEEAAARIHAGHRRTATTDACSRRSNSRYRAPVRTRANSSPRLTGVRSRVVSPGRIPGGKIGALRRIVQEDPVKRIVRIVRERGRSRFRDAAAIDDYEVGDRISPPKCVLVEVVGRLDLDIQRLRVSTKSRAAAKRLAKSLRREADEVRTTSGAILPNAGIGAFDPLTTLASGSASEAARIAVPPLGISGKC